MAAPVAASPAMLVHPPAAKWRPSAPAHTSACTAGDMATGATAITIAVNTAATSFVISYSFASQPGQPLIVADSDRFVATFSHARRLPDCLVDPTRGRL